MHSLKQAEPALSTLALTPEQAAKAAGLGRTTVYAALKSGGLPSLKIGKSRRIMISDLLRYLEGFRVIGE